MEEIRGVPADGWGGDDGGGDRAVVGKIAIAILLSPYESSDRPLEQFKNE